MQQTRPEFELNYPCPFSAPITITLHTLPVVILVANAPASGKSVLSKVFCKFPVIVKCDFPIMHMLGGWKAIYSGTRWPLCVQLSNLGEQQPLAKKKTRVSFAPGTINKC